LERVPARLAVVLNRCKYHLVGGFARRNHVKNLLAKEEVFFVRDDSGGAVQSVNTGTPLATQSGKVSKDIAPIALLASEAKLPAAGPRP
jgi:pilus assembly protein CpaE